MKDLTLGLPKFNKLALEQWKDRMETVLTGCVITSTTAQKMSCRVNAIRTIDSLLPAVMNVNAYMYGSELNGKSVEEFTANLLAKARKMTFLEQAQVTIKCHETLKQFPVQVMLKATTDLIEELLKEEEDDNAK